MFKRELYTFSKLSFWVSMLAFVGVPCTHFCMFFCMMWSESERDIPKVLRRRACEWFRPWEFKGEISTLNECSQRCFFWKWRFIFLICTCFFLDSLDSWILSKMIYYHILPNSSVVQLDETWQTISVNTTSSFGFSRHSWLPAHQERLEEEFQQKEVRLLDFSVEEATVLLSIDSVTLGITQFLLWFWCHPLFW